MKPDYKKLVRGAVLNARVPRGENYASRTACVSHMLGTGSTTATQLCIEFGKNPYEKINQ